jgi:hypothetical protein
MGLVSALVALLRAVPSLERLFLKVSDQLREAKAQKRYNEKLDRIDDAIAAAARGGGMHDSRVSGVGWNLDPDRSPAVSDSSTGSTGVHKGSTEQNS